MNITIEETPNPRARKFILGRQLTDGSARSYRSADEAKNDPLAAALFAIPKVVGVLIVNDFCTVNKASAGRWKTMIPRIEAVLREQLGCDTQADPGPGAPSLKPS